MHAMPSPARTPPLQREIAESELDGPLGRKARFLAAGRYYVSAESAIVHADTLSGSLIENIGVSERNLRVFGRLDFDLSPKHTLTAPSKHQKKSHQYQGVRASNPPQPTTESPS